MLGNSFVPLVILGRLRPLEPVVDKEHYFWFKISATRLNANLSYINIAQIPTDPEKHFTVLLHATASPIYIYIKTITLYGIKFVHRCD